jgi:hypothetical protein
VKGLKQNLVTRRQAHVEHFEILNQLKNDWDTLSAQHLTLTDRYYPQNIEVSVFFSGILLLILLLLMNAFYYYRKAYTKLQL